MTETMTAEAERAMIDHMNKPWDDLQKIDAIQTLHRERDKEIRRMQVRFERWLPVLISSRTSRVVKQLESTKAMGLCRQFIAEHFDAIVEAKGNTALSRFLAGEFTGGIKPISIVKMVKGDVEDIVETATIIEVMAAKYDSDDWSVATPEESDALVKKLEDPNTDWQDAEEFKKEMDAEDAAVTMPTAEEPATPDLDASNGHVTPDEPSPVGDIAPSPPPPMGRLPLPVRKAPKRRRK